MVFIVVVVVVWFYFVFVSVNIWTWEKEGREGTSAGEIDLREKFNLDVHLLI